MRADEERRNIYRGYRQLVEDYRARNFVDPEGSAMKQAVNAYAKNHPGIMPGKIEELIRKIIR